MVRFEATENERACLRRGAWSSTCSYSESAIDDVRRFAKMIVATMPPGDVVLGCADPYLEITPLTHGVWTNAPCSFVIIFTPACRPVPTDTLQILP